MTITDSDITFVFQGPVLPGAGGTAELVRLTRRAFPRSRCVLSTWTGADLSGVPFDRVVLSRDPGGLPGIKARDGAGESNNVNRQLLSTRRGLEEVVTDYAVKIRTDCALEHAGFLATANRFLDAGAGPRILAPSLFTIDPLMFEQMPYHVSDWFQFGPTPALQRYWSAPFMAEQDAVFYERRPHARHSTFMDRRFRTRLAVEQYLAVQYAEPLGYPVPQYHNDIADSVMEGHRRFVARHWLIVDPWDLGLRFSKYHWAYRSGFQRLNCLLFVDWYGLYLEEGGRPVGAMPARLLARRRMQKQAARLLGRWMDKAGPLLLRPGLKRMVNRLLAVLAWQSERRPPRVLAEPQRSLLPRP
ncbi:WavE lipopolysaccharide synthesis family protein [Nitrospira moscoviensis]|uniref:WavE lipopolysaccharide synthesis n=1 Tax=Nitrospira moscoviensis TaxID=42253 RepID=A0A0K2GJA8_NITMO|nr:WavE lipopolysaccharide synthesis family protein [Nitrospira moscoviensis]ALA61026.1 hypothetical protein NITMOv2_4655 [Nitrospira moscoviensis]